MRFLPCLAALALVLSSCNESVPGNSSPSKASPDALGVSACSAEFPRSRAQALLGVSLLDSGNLVVEGLYRQCQWFGLTGIGVLARDQASWTWWKESHFESQRAGFTERKVRNLSGDSTWCTRDGLSDLVVTSRKVEGLSILRVVPAEDCVGSPQTQQEVMVACRGATLSAVAMKSGASEESNWTATETMVSEICSQVP